MIQWGQFNNPANVNQLFPTAFTQTPIMACSYTYTGNNNVYYSDFPRPVDNQYWTIPHTDSKNIGLWVAIGY